MTAPVFFYLSACLRQSGLTFFQSGLQFKDVNNWASMNADVPSMFPLPQCDVTSMIRYMYSAECPVGPPLTSFQFLACWEGSTAGVEVTIATGAVMCSASFSFRQLHIISMVTWLGACSYNSCQISSIS